jgi:hypothetical protein
MTACRATIDADGNQREWTMGTIIEFPADAASRRRGSTVDGASGGMGTVLILPVVRIERDTDETSGDRGPQEGTATGRRRRRR